MHSQFHTIGIFGKYKDSSVSDTIAALTKFLEQRRIRVLLGETTAESIQGTRSEHIPQGDIRRVIDLAIVVGGDGTMLNASRILAEYGVPVIGVNLGRLGFLTDISVQTMIPDLTKIFAGEYLIESRMLLDVRIIEKHATSGEPIRFSALNDVVVSKGDPARLIDLQIHVDNEFVTSLRGDGVIVSTPTGSTAYALSAGGPILHPLIPAMSVVPICPHGLTNRPIVLHGTSTVEVSGSESTSDQMHLAIDGHFQHHLHHEDRVTIRRAAHGVQLIRTRGHNHYASLRSKLGWGKF